MIHFFLNDPLWTRPFAALIGVGVSGVGAQSGVNSGSVSGRRERAAEAEDTDEDIEAEDSWLTGKHLLPEDDAAGLQVRTAVFDNDDDGDDGDGDDDDDDDDDDEDEDEDEDKDEDDDDDNDWRKMLLVLQLFYFDEGWQCSKTVTK